MGLKLSTIQGNIAASGVECDSLEDVASIILDSNWSCGLYRGGHRNLSNFTEAHLFALDVDGGCPLDVARTLFAHHAHLIATTRSHQVEKLLPSGVVLPACDRFRVVLVLERPITTKEENYAVFEQLKRTYPFIDEACKDASRLFYPSTSIVSKRFDGKRIEVPATRAPLKVIEAAPAPAGFRGRLSSSTLRFLAEGAVPGTRHRALVKALLDLKQNLYTQEEAEAKLRHLELMDDHAWRTVTDIYENRPVRHAPRAAAASTEGGDVEGRANIEQWVHAWLVENNVAASYSRNIFMGTPSIAVPRSGVLRKMRLARVREGRPLQKETLEDIFNEWLEERRLGHLSALRAELSGFDERGLEELKRWCVAMFGADHNELYVEVLRHFVWQVKRKLFGLSVEFHMMPIFSGKQGSGKSTAIEKLLSPLKDLKSKPKGFGCVRDDREARLFIDHFVLFFDEMASAERTDVNEIKNLITSDVVEYRPMGTNDRDKGPNNAVFIGAANKQLSEIIMDDTGARRFFELNTSDKCDWDLINAVDYALIWKCIAEDVDTSPAREHWDAIAQLQEQDMRHRTPVEEFLTEIGASPSSESWVAASDLLRKFNDWLSSARWNPTSLGRKLRALGYTKRRVGGSSEWGISSPSLKSVTNGKGAEEDSDI